MSSVELRYILVRAVSRPNSGGRVPLIAVKLSKNLIIIEANGISAEPAIKK